MSYLNKPYYISLLNAAEIHGAAHQRPQKFSVMSVFPKSSVSQSKNNTLVWVYRKEIPTDFLLSKILKQEMSILFECRIDSSWHCTIWAIYRWTFKSIYYIGRTYRKLDFRGASNKLFGYTSIATIQRLGYILDEVLNAAEIADTLYMELTSYVKRFKYIPLTINKPKDCAERNNRWKIFVNTIIETDEIW